VFSGCPRLQRTCIEAQQIEPQPLINACETQAMSLNHRPVCEIKSDRQVLPSAAMMCAGGTDGGADPPDDHDWNKMRTQQMRAVGDLDAKAGLAWIDDLEKLQWVARHIGESDTPQTHEVK
jgi:hypothetical protein